MKLNVKYESEGRFGLGCAQVSKKINETTYSPPVAVVMPPFDYSGKTIISIADYKSAVNSEIRRVKGLSSKSQWLQKISKDAVYRNSPSSKLKGVGKKAMEKLQQGGFTKCSDIFDLSDHQLANVTVLPKKNNEENPSRCPGAHEK